MVALFSGHFFGLNLHNDDITHVTLDTRPSLLSACNIENVGVAWGRGYNYVLILLVWPAVVFHKDSVNFFFELALSFFPFLI